MKIMPIHKDDIEGIRYPDLDTKRKVWDFALADKINELIREVEELEEVQNIMLRKMGGKRLEE